MAIDPAVEAALISGGVTLAGLSLGWLLNRRVMRANVEHSDAEAGQIAVQSASLLLVPLNQRIADLSAKMASAEAMLAQMRSDHAQERIEWSTQLKQRDQQIAQIQTELTEYRGGVTVLIAQLQENGITPRWKPKTGPLGQKP